MSNSSERLEKILGFDAAKPQSVTGGLLKEVFGEIQEERLAQAKVVAKEQVKKAMELREKMYNTRKQFDNQIAKFEKELGKLVNSLESSLGDGGGGDGNSDGAAVETQDAGSGENASE